MAIICSFSSGLDGLKKHQQKDPVTVLAMMKARGRFSAFEASANEIIVMTVTRILNKSMVVVKDGMRNEYGKLVEITGGEYPWTKVQLTEGGERLLRDQMP